MKRATLLFAAVLLAFAAYSQSVKPTVVWGDIGNQTIKTPISSFDVVGSIGEVLCVSKAVGFNYVYATYDQNLQPVGEAEWEGDYMSFKRNRESSGLFITDDNQLVHVCLENRFDESGTSVTTVKSIDPNTLKPINSTDVVTRNPLKKYQWNYLRCQTDLSPNGTKIVVLANHRFDKAVMESGTEGDFRILVLKQDRTVLRNFTWKYPTELNRIDIKELAVDDDGNVFIWYQVFAKGTPPQTVVASFPANGQPAMQVVDLYETKKNYNTIRTTITPDFKVHFTGFYNDVFDKEAVRGVYSYTYNVLTNELSPPMFTTVSDSFRNLFAASSKKPDLHHKATLLANDGSFIFLGELVSIGSTTLPSTDPLSNGKSDQIVIVKVDAAGKVVSETIVHKRQTGKNTMLSAYYEKDSRGSTNTDGFFSYLYTFDGDRLKLIFNDHESNANQYNPALISGCSAGTSTISMYAEVNLDNGSYRKYPLFSGNDRDILVLPMASVVMSPKQVIVVGYDKNDGSLNKHRLGKVTFN